MKKINGLVLSALTAAFLVGCGGGGGSSSKTPTTPTVTPTDVTVERGAVYGATVTDAAGQVATQKTGTNVYVFATTPVYPITASGGIVDIDNNGVDEGDIELTTPLTSYSKVITPITDYLGDTTTVTGKAKLAKLKEISGVTNENDLITKVASELSTEVLIMTNTLYDLMNDGDTTNDDFLTDYDNSEFKTTFAELKTEADKYSDKKEIAKALEEKVVTNLGLTKLSNDDLSTTTTTTTLKVADLTKWVEYEGGNYSIATVSGSNVTFDEYYYDGSEWKSETTPSSISYTKDTTNPYKISYVDSITKEEGTFTILSTKEVPNYSDLYKSKATVVITKMGTQFDWYRWETANPINWTTQVPITNIDELYAYFSGVSNATVTKESDKVVMFVDKEYAYYRLVQENGNYYIEEAFLEDVGYTESEEIYTGTSLDEFILNIKAPAPVFTSWGNTYADENQTSAYTPTVTDTLKVTYSLLGLESSYFNIDSATGVVTFKVAPDYETKLAYSFYIIAKNSAGKISTQLVNIKINNLEESTTIPTTPIDTIFNLTNEMISGKQLTFMDNLDTVVANFFSNGIYFEEFTNVEANDNTGECYGTWSIDSGKLVINSKCSDSQSSETTSVTLNAIPAEGVEGKAVESDNRTTDVKIKSVTTVPTDWLLISNTIISISDTNFDFGPYGDYFERATDNSYSCQGKWSYGTGKEVNVGCGSETGKSIEFPSYTPTVGNTITIKFSSTPETATITEISPF